MLSLGGIGDRSELAFHMAPVVYGRDGKMPSVAMHQLVTT
jgi:hypothetical protein